jgi:hypothetical protein
MFNSLFNEATLQLLERLNGINYRGTNKEMEARRHLVVSTPGRVKLAGYRPDLLGEIAFNIHVNILIREAKLELSPVKLRSNLPQTLHDSLALSASDDSALTQHSSMSDAALDVERRKPLIEANRCPKLLSEGIR